MQVYKECSALIGCHAMRDFTPYFVLPRLASAEESAAKFEGSKGFQPQTPKKWPRPSGPKRGPSADDLRRRWPEKLGPARGMGSITPRPCTLLNLVARDATPRCANGIACNHTTVPPPLSFRRVAKSAGTLEFHPQDKPGVFKRAAEARSIHHNQATEALLVNQPSH